MFYFLLIQLSSKLWLSPLFDLFLTPSPTVATYSFSNLPNRLYLKDTDLVSQSVMVVRMSDRMLLYQKNIDERVEPASLTKIMTVLVALDKGIDLEKMVEMDADDYRTLLQKNAAVTGLYPNEKVTIRDLLYGILLPSGADASITLAKKIAGSEEAYVSLMNEKASALGMVGTYFDNVTGLHSETHYTTVRDLVILFETALKNSVFRTIVSSTQYQTTPSFVHNNGVLLEHTLFRYQQRYFPNLGGILGGKTGYTPQAGFCLASWFRKNGQQYLMVSVQAPKLEYNYSPLVDVQTVFEQLS